MVSIRVSGLANIASRYAKISKTASDKMDKFLIKVSADIETNAKLRVPVDTGFLKSSISHALISEGLAMTWAAANYGSYVEYGTTRMGAQPFMRPAARAVHSRFGKELDSLKVEVLR